MADLEQALLAQLRLGNAELACLAAASTAGADIQLVLRWCLSRAVARVEGVFLQTRLGDAELARLAASSCAAWARNRPELELRRAQAVRRSHFEDIQRLQRHGRRAWQDFQALEQQQLSGDVIDRLWFVADKMCGKARQVIQLTGGILSTAAVDPDDLAVDPHGLLVEVGSRVGFALLNPSAGPAACEARYLLATARRMQRLLRPHVETIPISLENPEEGRRFQVFPPQDKSTHAAWASVQPVFRDRWAQAARHCFEEIQRLQQRGQRAWQEFQTLQQLELTDDVIHTLRGLADEMRRLALEVLQPTGGGHPMDLAGLTAESVAQRPAGRRSTFCSWPAACKSCCPMGRTWRASIRRATPIALMVSQSSLQLRDLS